MPDTLIITSIPHSGTHFIMHLLGYDNWRNKGVLPWKASQGRPAGGVYFDHVLPQQKHIYLPLIADPENVTAIPLRHPRLTLKSWQDRKKPIEIHDIMWRLMANEIAPLMPYFVPVDSDDRDWYLEQLETRLGRELETEWKALGVRHSNQHLRWRDMHEIPLEREIKPFLDRFYAT